jgi:hypothetical protein
VLPGVVWINAFRAIGLQIHGDVGSRLTAESYAPDTAAAPLLAGLARGPGEALRLLRRRHGLAQDTPLEVLSIVLVGLRCRIEGALVRELASNLVYPKGLVRPDLLEVS